MISVKVEAWPFISELFGGEKTHRYVLKMMMANNTTLGDLIEKLSERKPAFKQILQTSKDNQLFGISNVSVVINGRLASSKSDYQRKLKDGDRIILVQGFAGG